ncbi:Uncharacterised protein [Pragia fontium]|nr:Uncharacterised protein [Pragia fontium]
MDNFNIGDKVRVLGCAVKSAFILSYANGIIFTTAGPYKLDGSHATGGFLHSCIKPITH